jgi:AraC family transcriptional regulator, regulatory protein of adaptative response / DNA-3-methyladenine glycosylase II
MRQSDIYYQAMLTRDPRFDGKFFVAVKTTGIYCRPICPARPKRENVEFYPNALAAEKAGYRPCLRCRPECAPLSPAWVGKSATVQRALQLIAANRLLECDEDSFSEKLGVSARHLRRLFEEELGKTPKQIHDNNRLGFARQLVVETKLPITEIAFTAGFSSIRRFNDAFKDRFHRAPSDLRKKSGEKREEESNATSGSRDLSIQLSLSYRPPFDWTSTLQVRRSHQIAGVENVTESSYSRIFRMNGSLGELTVTHDPKRAQLLLNVLTTDAKNLYPIAQNVRQMFDLDSDPIHIANTFSSCKILSELTEKHPGLRITRGWDPFESAIDAILGQFVSVKHANLLVAQLVEGYGETITHPQSGKPVILFPTVNTLAREDLTQVKTTMARKRSIRDFSRLVLEKKLRLDLAQDFHSFKGQLLEIDGIGPWTAEIISLRSLGDTDAFPATDLIIKRVIDSEPDLNTDAIRPWRGYAAIYLWKEYAQQLSGAKRKAKK